KGHFARECRSGRNQEKRSYSDNGRSNAPTNESSSQALVAQDGLGGYDWSNNFEIEPVNYALMAISSSSSSSFSDKKVQKCSKQCLESFKTLQKNYDSEGEKHSRARLEIQGYKLALESLESRILVHEKNELAWDEKYEFQNYKLKCKEIKINNLNLELEKVVKERDDLKLKSSDEESTPANDRFSKADGYHAVPSPITRNFLTLRADISFASLDEYAIRKKIIESKTTDLNTKPSETVDDEDDVSEVQTVSPVKTNETQTVKTILVNPLYKGSYASVYESVVPKPKINRDKVIIEDWNSDDEDDVSAVKTVSPVKTNETQTERVKSILLLAIPDEYLLKFHNVADAKSLWVAIKSRFQKLISQLEVHAAPVSKEDINQKFLRSLPPSWSQIALIMRNKPNIDQTDIDDLCNNLRVYEDEMKRSLSSTSNSQNLTFLSSDNTSSTNEVSPASGNFRVNPAGGTSSSNQVSSTLGVDEVVCSFFAQQTTSPPLNNEDLQQIDQDDLEELDIRWQVAMLTVSVQRFIQKTGRNLDFKGKKLVTFDKSKVECYNCHKKGHFAKECKSGRNQGKRSYGDNGRRNATTNEPSSQALVAQDGLGGYDWSNDFDEPVNYALMAISSSSSSSSSDNEVQNYSKQCLESFKTLQKNYDSEREKHSRARLEIQGYELALESLESRIIGHEKNELAWGEKYEFQNYELKCREVKINNLKMELEKVVKERDELKVKIEK
ncbi:ribonuclease H-like domain-containing protein, partial [Tanacetum coccineum]